MKAIYHTTATTAEDLRKDLLEWLERQINIADSAAARSTLVRDINHNLSRKSAFSEMATFWREIRIDERGIE